jgi:hypothetical protein
LLFTWGYLAACPFFIQVEEINEISDGKFRFQQPPFFGKAPF